MSALSRRTFGTLVGGGTAAAALGTLASPSEARAGERRFAAAGRRPRRKPNILLILGDDLGASDLSSYGAPHISTPNLDRLARDGVRFTQAYSGSATCSPTRFSLYTGRYPGRLAGGLLEPINAKGVGLPPGHPTLASQLRKAGYETALIGKWHAGFLPDFSPTRSGWDTFFGNFGGALDYFSKIGALGEYDLYEGDAEYRDLRYYTDVLTERAVDFVKDDHAKPWLLNLNFTTPHWPWETAKDKAVSDAITAKIKAGLNPTLALLHNDGGSVEIYAEMVESLDASIGKVLQALRRSGQEQDTIVLFSSDNGGERFSYNWPLTGNKASLNEGGIRVPNILRWPAAIDGGQYSDVPVITPDWTATLLEIAGASADPAHPLDGRSLAGHLLRGAEPPAHDLFWRTRGWRALRRGDWKYLRTPSGGDQLFNLAEDEREQRDFTAAQPTTLASLKAAWEKIDATLLPYS
ncbi:sulfatase-like hydrolase/transferase [Actinomadura parmotrematis]|uniref:Sulfatase-like hydrolase/transferase n=1 Tax=Actinomadura parmotrematis TaxID=2864039 RepID=A0ABS7FY20_9ACTN|nr:sulfatase-like hydrolase/transferase [Actinomadura parmotrematis]MBW8485329.1 sulfatase-like hydrolase/transferase [Actinomadura parmotrematis]